MCGVFGIISKQKVNENHLKYLVEHAQQRGKDSSGLIVYKDKKYSVQRADFNIEKLLKKVDRKNAEVVMGHSRLITNGLGDNQPVVRNDVIVLHNGIVVNDEEVWKKTGLERKLEIDTEVLAALTEDGIKNNVELKSIAENIISLCRGVIASAIILPKLGKVILYSNNGSLYLGDS